MGEALIWRVYPGSWRVMLDCGSSGRFSLVEELSCRPNERELTEIVVPRVRAWRSAVGSAVRALTSMATSSDSGILSAKSRVPSSCGEEVAIAGSEPFQSNSSTAVICLEWQQIQSEVNLNAFSLYEAAALLRQRCYGESVTFANDHKALHLLQVSVCASWAAIGLSLHHASIPRRSC